MASFEIAVTKTLAHEGGYVPPLSGDPGGETNFGISKRAHPDIDIKALTREQAVEIYRREYWQSWMDAALDQRIVNAVFDWGVTSGPRVPAERLSRAIERVSLGLSKTHLRMNNCLPEKLTGAAADEVVREYTRLRLNFYARLKVWDHYAASYIDRALDW